MAKYLHTMVHYLTAEEAVKYQDKGYYIYKHTDGSWTAIYLVDKPVQVGQPPWQGPGS